MELTEKPIYKRVVACFCAFLICCLVVFCGFAIPKVNAESIADQWEDWMDQTFFEGSAYAVDALLDDITDNSGYGAVYTGICMGLNMIQVPETTYINSKNFAVCQGAYYWGSSHRGICVSALQNYNTHQSTFSDGLLLCDASDFRVKCTLFGTISDFYSGVSSGGAWFRGYGFSSGGHFTFSNDKDTTYLSNPCDRSGSGSDFYALYSENTIPTISGQNLGYYINIPRDANYIAGGFGSRRNVKPSDLGIDDVTIDISNPSDFVVNVLNDKIIELDPDFELIFIPQEDTTETQSPSGCGCHVDVYVEPTVIVNVEPTIIVDNNIQFPSEWFTDYTSPSIPSHETIPFPTQDSSNTEPVTMPTMDVDEYKQTYGNAIEFWFYLAAQLIEKLGLELLTGFAFVLSVVGFVLWRLGSSGGGKND